MSKVVGVGDVAPNFKAEGTGGKTYSLEDYKGKPVVLAFYPGDATEVCTQQLTSYNEDFPEFSRLDAQVLGISPQNVESHERFSADHKFQFPLLYDEDKQIGKLYGILGPLGFYRRSVFVIDSEGIIRYAKRMTAGLRYPKADQIFTALDAL